MLHPGVLRGVVPTSILRKRLMLVAVSCALAAALGATLGALTRFELPGPEPPLERAQAEMTSVLDRRGSRIASFAREKRLVLESHEIPESFRLALLASEDSRFETHLGVDPIGALRALWAGLRRGRLAQGASTLTMQLAGNLFLDRSQRTFERKLEEVLLALEIERRYSKREILAMYCNQVHFGHGLYGLEAAARFYFGKPARELALDESATLVGLLPRPAAYSPLRNPDLARRKRDLVLRRMVEEGYLTRAEAQRHAERPIVLAAVVREAAERPAQHFVENIRRSLLASYGGERVERGGLVVRTTLDPRLQALAERALADGLERLDLRQRLRDEDRLSAGQAEGALVALDPRSGEILALVGGREFERSEYDRARQAHRQPGSLFKPFVFATALSEGFTLADVLIDEPTVFLDAGPAAPYQPENFERSYHGAITLRTALEQSVNIVTVKLLDQVGAADVIDTARRLGVESPLEPYPALALGAFELSLLEVTSAYGAFANDGLWIEPHGIASVEDRAGQLLEQARPRVREAVDPRVAFLMNEALAGVIQNGTGSTAGRALDGRTLAGKTGTTDSFTDAWFVGYSPELVVGVWVGHDDRRSLGEGETGARAALPIWIDFMRDALAGRADRAFTTPAGVLAVSIDQRTGLRSRASEDCVQASPEWFLEGTEPVERCSAARHAQLALPYPFHAFDLDRRGALEISNAELERLLRQEYSVSVDLERAVLQGPGGVTLPLAIGEPETPFDAEPLGDDATGVDGRAARRIRLGVATRKHLLAESGGR